MVSQTSICKRRPASFLPEIDWRLLLSILALVGLGLVMVTSASLASADRTYGSAFFFLFRHGIALGLALLAGLLVFRVPIRWWERFSIPLFFLGIGLLVLVLVPGIGRSANGATRWIPLGPLNLQSSEFMKFFAVLYLAGYLDRQNEQVVYRAWAFLKPMALIALAAVLILAQPDFGTTAVLLATVLGMLFLGGVQVRFFFGLILSVSLAMVALVLSSPYRLARVTSYLHPFEDPFNTGFQLSQALIAFGRGGWFGVGLGNGIQKQFYLPEAHTDFIMAVIGEELGLAGVLLVLALFAFIVWRAFQLGFSAHRLGYPFHALLAMGFGLGLGLQALINVGVNVGLLPTKGLTMPFLSYGSNSLIVAFMIAGVLLRIDYELRQREKNQVPEPRRWVRL